MPTQGYLTYNGMTNAANSLANYVGQSAAMGMATNQAMGSANYLNASSVLASQAIR